MLMSSSNYDAIYHAALVLHDLSGDPNLCYPAMRYCSANGVRGATDWLAEALRRHLSEKLSLSDSELRQMCLFALEHGYDDIAMTCFQRCSAGALNDMKWFPENDLSANCPHRIKPICCKITGDVCHSSGPYYACVIYDKVRCGYDGRG